MLGLHLLPHICQNYNKKVLVCEVVKVVCDCEEEQSNGILLGSTYVGSRIL